MSNIDKQELRLTAEKAKDNFMPNFMVPTRDLLALLDELDKWQQESSAWQSVAEKQLALAEDAGKRIAELEAREVVPDEMTPQQASRSYGGEVRGYRDGWNACRAKVIENMFLDGMDSASTDNTNQQFESLSRGGK